MVNLIVLTNLISNKILIKYNIINLVFKILIKQFKLILQLILFKIFSSLNIINSLNNFNITKLNNINLNNLYNLKLNTIKLNNLYNHNLNNSQFNKINKLYYLTNNK
jgi:hypothetical protein